MDSVLGIDCGGVIFYSSTGILLPGVLKALQKIVSSRQFDKVYIVSKVGPFTKLVFLFRLWQGSFWKHTGISRENIYFCRRHEDKGAICETLGITHFVDDRIRVLHHLKNVPYLYAFHPWEKKHKQQYSKTVEKVKFVASWRELSSLLLGA